MEGGKERRPANHGPRTPLPVPPPTTANPSRSEAKRSRANEAEICVCTSQSRRPAASRSATPTGVMDPANAKRYENRLDAITQLLRTALILAGISARFRPDPVERNSVGNYERTPIARIIERRTKDPDRRPEPPFNPLFLRLRLKDHFHSCSSVSIRDSMHCYG